MHLEFIGAAQTVTGSMHLLKTARATLLLDCSLFQGKRREAHESALANGEVERVVLAHAQPKPQRILAKLLASKGLGEPLVPAPGDELAIGT